jgi:hypothetical protein
MSFFKIFLLFCIGLIGLFSYGLRKEIMNVAGFCWEEQRFIPFSEKIDRLKTGRVSGKYYYSALRTEFCEVTTEMPFRHDVESPKIEWPTLLDRAIFGWQYPYVCTYDPTRNATIKSPEQQRAGFAIYINTCGEPVQFY